MHQFTKKYVNLPNGEKYAYIEMGKGEDLLLIHGNMSSSVHYMAIMPQLAEKYHCVAMDLRGFGDSSFVKPFFSLAELADDVKMFASALGIKKAKVVGWSTGGGIALELTAKYPEFVESLFCIEGASHRGYPIYVKDENNNALIGKPYLSIEEMSKDKVQVLPMLTAFATKNYLAVSQMWNSVIYVSNLPSKEDNDVYVRESAKEVCLPYLDWALANFNMSDSPNAYADGSDRIKNVKCKCAFTTGDADLVVPAYMVMENVSALPQSKLIKYENCGHSPLVDCPEKLVSDIKEFFN